MPNPEQAPQQDLPITSSDGAGLGYGAHEFTPHTVEEEQRPQPATEAAPPAGPPEEPPITYDAPSEGFIPDINPEDNIQNTPAMPNPEQFSDAQDNADRVKSMLNK